MELLKNTADSVFSEVLPRFKTEIEFSFVVFMVLLAADSADRKWHKNNIFYSYLRTLFYVKGSSLILAICSGSSPIAQLAKMDEILLVFLLWWLVLFAPFNIFCRILEVEFWDVRPIILVLGALTALQNVLHAAKEVDVSLDTYPGSLVAVLLGTIAGGGTLAVASVFGDFARQISDKRRTRFAFITALTMTVVKIYFPICISSNFVLLLLIISIITLHVAEEMNHKIGIFTVINDVISKIINIRDLMDKSKSE